MPLAHLSTKAAKLRSLARSQSANEVVYEGSALTGTLASGGLSGYGPRFVDTGLNTLTLEQQMAQPTRYRSKLKSYSSPPSQSTKKIKASTTFGVVGHQEDSHLDRLEKMHRSRPGPADYNAPRLSSQGGKFNLSQAKSDVEWKMYYAAQTPGPGQYEIKTKLPRGGQFSTAYPKSDIEWKIYYASRKPGVGEYDLDKAFHNYVGPGPATRLSSIPRGLYAGPSPFKPRVLPRDRKNGYLEVEVKEHKKRLKRRSFARFRPTDEKRLAIDSSQAESTVNIPGVAVTEGSISRIRSISALRMAFYCARACVIPCWRSIV